MAALTLPYSATEALQQVRVLLNEPTASFWTDEELNNFIIEGVIDISSRGLAYEKRDSIILAASTLEYTGMGYIGVALPSNITAITKANPGVVSSVAHALAIGDVVYFSGLTQMTNLNGTYQTVSAVGSANVFSINDTSAYAAAETTGGACGFKKNSIADIVKISSCIYDDGVYGYRGLVRIHPRMINHLPNIAPGEPFYFWHFANRIGIWPLTSAAIVAAAGKVQLFYSAVSYAITDLPPYYQSLAVLYAAAKAKIKDGKYASANQLFAIYLNALSFQRTDLYEPGVDSKDMLQQPDNTQYAPSR
jgi:hypothetical protein